MGDEKIVTNNKWWCLVMIGGYVVSALVGLLYSLVSFWDITTIDSPVRSDVLLLFYLGYGMIGGLLLVHPMLLTVMNLVYLLLPGIREKSGKYSIWLERITIVEGVLYNLVFLYYTLWLWIAIFSETPSMAIACLFISLPIIFFSVRGAWGYLRIRKNTGAELCEKQMSTAVKAMNGGIFMCLLWIGLMCFAMFSLSEGDRLFAIVFVYLGLFPLNCILIAWKVIREKKTFRCA